MSTIAPLRPLLLVLLTVTVGCQEPDSKPPTNATTPPAAQTQRGADSESDGIVRIAVLVDGTILVDAEAVPVESLAEQLDALGQIKAIWYHRESPEAGEPHENATKVIAEIVNRKLPVSMYLDREFTQRLELSK